AGTFPPGSNPWLIFGLGLFAAMLLGHLAGTSGRGPAGLELLALGACLGPIFPTLIGIVFTDSDLPHATAYGATFAIGAAGSLIWLPGIGIYGRRKKIQPALYIPMFLCILMAFTVLVAALWTWPEKKPRAPRKFHIPFINSEVYRATRVHRDC